MKKISQTIKGPQGNCLQACLASILELELDDVPNFHAMRDDPRSNYPIWWIELQSWLNKRGLCFMEMRLTDKTPVMPMPYAPTVLFYTTTPSKIRHCVVGQIDGTGLNELWNPDPDTPVEHVESICFLVPIDPAKTQVQKPLITLN